MGALMVALGYARSVGVTGGLLAGLMLRGAHEAAHLAVAAGGADEHTFHSIAGIGDLMAAIASPERPEVRVGELLAQGQSAEVAARSVNVRVEALGLVPRLRAWAREHDARIPVFDALGEVLLGHGRKESILADLMQ
jgi:glycerol-3-phosphate dehydrogenase (NAD(P)+)